MTVENRIGASLQTLRESASLSVEVLAERISMPAVTIVEIEQGIRIPSASQVACIAAAIAAELQAPSTRQDQHKHRATGHGHPSTG